MTTTTRLSQSSASPFVLFLAVELGSTSWRLAFAVGLGHRPRIVRVAARDLARVLQEIERAKVRLGLPRDTPVRSCYEAGRDGFWLHRALNAHGIVNAVIDPASITVDRRARRVKTDRVDVIALITQLIHAHGGDRRGWREIHVPTVEAEADRQLQRERETVRNAHRAGWNRIQSLLITQGVVLPPGRRHASVLSTLRLWDGSSLPPALQARLAREWQHVDALADRLRTINRLQHVRVTTQDDTVAQQATQMMRLRGIGEIGAATLSTELFAWRAFRNGGQVGASVGLTPTPYRSDQEVREQGISRSGNRHVRWLAVQLAWDWVRYQPTSALTQWYLRRFGDHGRARKIGIIALARKLLIALWRWVDQGVLPEGALLKA